MSLPSQPRRHCMVVHNYYPLGEPRVQRQAEALAAAGFHVDVICLRAEAESALQREAGVTIYRLPIRRRRLHTSTRQAGTAAQFLEYLLFAVLAFFRLSWMHLRQRYRVVEVHNLPDFLVFAALLPRLTGAAIILNLHDLMPEFYLSRFGGRQETLLARLVKWQERVSCRFAHHVITVTHPWRDTLIQRGVPANKCSVVMNVADDRIFHSLTSSPTIDETLGAAAGVRIVYHGNLTYRNGIDLLIQAFAQARAQRPGIQLLIHGRGDYLPELQALAAQMQPGDAIIFSTNLLPMQELPRLLATANIGVVPYRRDLFMDGILPTKMMEYAALGIAVIAVRTPVIENYFAEDMVVFVPDEDVSALAAAIIRLVDHPKHRAALAHNIQRFNERFSWPAQKAAYLQLVTRLGDGDATAHAGGTEGQR